METEEGRGRGDRELISPLSPLILTFDRPAEKIKLLKHRRGDGIIKNIRCKILHGTIFQRHFNDSDGDILRIFLGITRKRGKEFPMAASGDLQLILKTHNTKMPVVIAVSKKPFSIVTTVENNNGILTDA